MSGGGAHGDPFRGRGLRKRTVSAGDEYWFVTNDRYSDLPQRSGSFQAMVRAGDSVTAYLRSGRGDPVVLLRRTDLADPVWGTILAEVAGRFRAILPEKVPEGDGFASWFRSFLDGLGLGTVRVVADAHYGMSCATTGMLDPDWLSSLVVVCPATDRDRVAAALQAAAEPLVSTAIIDSDGQDQDRVAADVLRLLTATASSTG